MKSEYRGLRFDRSGRQIEIGGYGVYDSTRDKEYDPAKDPFLVSMTEKEDK